MLQKRALRYCSSKGLTELFNNVYNLNRLIVRVYAEKERREQEEEEIDSTALVLEEQIDGYALSLYERLKEEYEEMVEIVHRYAAKHDIYLGYEDEEEECSECLGIETEDEIDTDDF